MGYGGFYGGGGGGGLGRVAQEPVNSAGFAAGEGWGAQHNLSQAEVAQDAELRNTGTIRGSGSLTHYRPISHAGPEGAPITWASAGPGEGPAAAAPGAGKGLSDIAQLGEPTSYGGGRGAPTPIEVFNSAGRSYVNPEGGQGYKTPVQAGQAWNQQNAEPGTPEATFRPAGTTTEEQKIAGKIEEVKAGGPATMAKAMVPGAEAESGKAVAAGNYGKYAQALPGKLGHGQEYNEDTGKWETSTDPAFLALHNKYAPMSYTNPEGAAKGMQADYQNLQNDRLVQKHGEAVMNTWKTPAAPEVKKYLLGTPEGRASMLPDVTGGYLKQNPPVKRSFWNVGPTPPVEPFAQ